MEINSVLIDTNIYSLAMRGENEVIQKLQHINKIGFSTISIGELLSGFRGGSRQKQNIKELQRFLESPRVIVYSVDEDTGEYYADVLYQLKQAGTPIPTNDIWIAATTLQYGLKIWTKDKHFQNIPYLELMN